MTYLRLRPSLTILAHKTERVEIQGRHLEHMTLSQTVSENQTLFFLFSSRFYCHMPRQIPPASNREYSSIAFMISQLRVTI